MPIHSGPLGFAGIREMEEQSCAKPMWANDRRPISARPSILRALSTSSQVSAVDAENSTHSMRRLSGSGDALSFRPAPGAGVREKWVREVRAAHCSNSASRVGDGKCSGRAPREPKSVTAEDAGKARIPPKVELKFTQRQCNVGMGGLTGRAEAGLRGAHGGAMGRSMADDEQRSMPATTECRRTRRVGGRVGNCAWRTNQMTQDAREAGCVASRAGGSGCETCLVIAETVSNAWRANAVRMRRCDVRVGGLINRAEAGLRREHEGEEAGKNAERSP
ncbi:hypothetical protein C8R44DRAFT_851570 [Mycena epipterygia]|nr:hypothetical protein C8R44DRAFT_851570 [Mycena epipterygia]